MSKVSDSKFKNLFWVHDLKNTKNFINFPTLFETNLDVEGSRMFSSFKRELVIDLSERGYYPNTLMPEIAKAEEDYQLLKTMFKLQ
jgi:hypothetical protein